MVPPCIGQLAELGYHLIFYYSGCIVQDPRMRQELGIDLRVGYMFPIDNLHLPPVALIFVTTAAAVVSSLPSLALWHSPWSCTIFSGTTISF